MNDLDLRTALHRDADLVGPPPPDLLDRLLQRRRHQRRQRAGMAGAVLGIVVIVAGIPVGQSLMSRSDVRPAAPTSSPTPSVTQQVVPTTPATPVTTPPAPVTTPAGSAPPSVTPSAPATSRPAATSASVIPPPVCDWAAIGAALPKDTGQDTYTLVRGQGELCSGAWAAAGYSQVTTLSDGTTVPDGQAGLFHYVGGRWTFLDRTTNCGDPAVPRAVWERACNVD